MNSHWQFDDTSVWLSVHTHKLSQYWSFPGRCHSNRHSPWPSCSVTYTSFVPFLKWRLLTLAKGNLILVWGLPPSDPNTSRNPDPQWATNRLLSSSKSIPSGPPSRSPVKRQTHDNETENKTANVNHKTILSNLINAHRIIQLRMKYNMAPMWTQNPHKIVFRHWGPFLHFTPKLVFKV